MIESYQFFDSQDIKDDHFICAKLALNDLNLFDAYIAARKILVSSIEMLWLFVL